MSLPDMRNWSEEAKQNALDALKERDALLGFNVDEVSSRDEEDYSRGFSASYADAARE